MSILVKITKIIIFATFYFEIAVKLSKSRIKKILAETSKMHMDDIVMLDAEVFEVEGGAGGP